MRNDGLMHKNNFYCLLILLAVCSWSHSLFAQDYRVYTRIFHQSEATPEVKPEVIARSLTIWHAGKAYDWIDQVGELVIYDPTERRYTIVSDPHKLGCTIDFSELRNFQKVARAKAQEYVEDISKSQTDQADREIAKIKFQLDPNFQVIPDSNGNSIRFESPVMGYRIETINAPNVDTAEAFRQYADWAAQLNYVLHGQSLIPGPRMFVNEELRLRSLIPIRVQLNLNDNVGTKLTAEHTIQWDLSPTDRERIRDWQAVLKDPQYEYVDFQKYQRTVLQD